MAEIYTITLTIEDSAKDATDVANVYSGVRSKEVNKKSVMSIAADIANNFKLKNSYRRVELDCAETIDGRRTIFHNINIDTSETFGVKSKSDLDKLIESINKENNQ